MYKMYHNIILRESVNNNSAILIFLPEISLKENSKKVICDSRYNINRTYKGINFHGKIIIAILM